jgi:muramoyltetrapeptide carboxypeptidase
MYNPYLILLGDTLELTVRLIRPSSRELENNISSRIDSLRSKNLSIRFDDLPSDPNWAYTSSTIVDRAAALRDALLEGDTDFVMAARGGYGASDLLPLMPWAQLTKATPKFLIGFSDISALHSALYSRLGWPSIHGPMPITSLWNKNTSLDTDELLALMRSIKKDSSGLGALPVSLVSSPETSLHDQATLSGPLFGGCFSVLTSLIGTPYFPRSLKNHIIFIEDIDEHPGRLMRALNQWLLGECFVGAKALVVGYLRSMGEKLPDNASFVLNRIASRVAPLPVYHSPLIGHTSPNFPVVIGATASIAPLATGLPWNLSWRWAASTPRTA